MNFLWHSLRVPDQYGRRAIVTGANTGLGYQTALALAASGAEVVMAVRDLDRGQAAAQRIRDEVDDAKLRIVHLDLADLASVHDFAATEAAAGPVDLLVNNAGLMLVPRRVLTRDGFESQMGVNHLGHFALTADLLPALLQAESGRVVSRDVDRGPPIPIAGPRVGVDRRIHANGCVQPVEVGGRLVRRGARPSAAGGRRHRDGRCSPIRAGRPPVLPPTGPTIDPG